MTNIPELPVGEKRFEFALSRAEHGTYTYTAVTHMDATLTPVESHSWDRAVFKPGHVIAIENGYTRILIAMLNDGTLVQLVEE